MIWWIIADNFAWAAGVAVAAAAAFRVGRARTRFDAEVAAYERRIEANQAPRHAGPAQISAPGASRPTVRHIPGGGRPGWYTRQPAPSSSVTAADIAPVIWPQPGTRIPVRPQPGRDSGAGTVTMPKVTDTGELAAAMDKFIARLETDGETYRKENRLS